MRATAFWLLTSAHLNDQRSSAVTKDINELRSDLVVRASMQGITLVDNGLCHAGN